LTSWHLSSHLQEHQPAYTYPLAFLFSCPKPYILGPALVNPSATRGAVR
jgi:hypothetical protein